MIVPIGSRVFISYSHDSDAHRERILQLANTLVYEGIDCWCDQYVEDGSPEQGWPQWMEENVRIADYILVVCSPIYLARFEGREVAGRGLGVKFESILLTQHIYDNDSRNRKIIPIVLDSSNRAHIPAILNPFTHYCVSDAADYDKLYSRLTRQVPNVRPTVGQLRTLTGTGTGAAFHPASVSSPLTATLASTDATLHVIPGFTDSSSSMHPNLKIAQAFFGQPVTRRFSIASELGLLEPGESPADVNREELSAQILLRAKAKGLLAQLWASLFNEGLDPNPFK